VRTTCAKREDQRPTGQQEREEAHERLAHIGRDALRHGATQKYKQITL
jgi:hypothetical protein